MHRRPDGEAPLRGVDVLLGSMAISLFSPAALPLRGFFFSFFTSSWGGRSLIERSHLSARRGVRDDDSSLILSSLSPANCRIALSDPPTRHGSILKAQRAG